jgi:hypothetical protein
MVITEAELREAWRNGAGTLPDLPPDARLTPAAADFLASRGLVPAGRRGPAALCSREGGIELDAPPGTRLILTSQEINELLQRDERRILVHASVTLTDAARERLRAAGVRILPFVEPPAPPLTQPAALPAALPGQPAAPRASKDELFERVRAAVLARVDVGPDKSVLDAVIRSVLGSL